MKRKFLKRTIHLLTIYLVTLHLITVHLHSYRIHPLASSTGFSFLKIEEDAYFGRMGEIRTVINEREGISVINDFWFQNLKILGLKFVHKDFYFRFFNLYVPPEIERRSGVSEDDIIYPFTTSEGEFGARSSLFNISYEYYPYRIGIKIFEERIDVYKAMGFSIDFLYRYKNFGFMIENLGPAVKFNKKYFNIPLTLRAGGFKDFKKFALFYEIKKPIDDYPWITVSVNYPVLPYLHISGGYSYRFYGNNLGFLNGLNFGFGFGVKNICFDYSYRNYGILGDTHKFSFRWFFGRKRVKKKKIKKEFHKKKLLGPNIKGVLYFNEYNFNVGNLKKITFATHLEGPFKIEVKEKREFSVKVPGKAVKEFKIKHNVETFTGFVNYFFDKGIGRGLKAYFIKSGKSYELKEKEGLIVLEAPYLEDFVLYRGKSVKHGD